MLAPFNSIGKVSGREAFGTPEKTAASVEADDLSLGLYQHRDATALFGERDEFLLCSFVGLLGCERANLFRPVHKIVVDVHHGRSNPFR
jgi:hypothetical protein